MIPYDVVIAVFDDHHQADAAVRKLIDSGFDMKSFSVVGKGFHAEEKIVGLYTIGDRMKMWGKYGAFWGGLWGLLMGGVFLTIPVFGPIVVLGHLASVIVSVVEGAPGGSAAKFGGPVCSEVSADLGSGRLIRVRVEGRLSFGLPKPETVFLGCGFPPLMLIPTGLFPAAIACGGCAGVSGAVRQAAWHAGLGAFRRNRDARGKIALRRLDIGLRSGGSRRERDESVWISAGGCGLRRAQFRRWKRVAGLCALRDTRRGACVQFELRTRGSVGRGS